MKRGGPLKNKSDKREELDPKRRDFVKEQLTKRPWCEAGPIIGALILIREGGWPHTKLLAAARAGCDSNSSQMHEPLTRARAPGPETILDEDNSVALCTPCHRWVHANPELAMAINLLKASPMVLPKIVPRRQG